MNIGDVYKLGKIDKKYEGCRGLVKILNSSFVDSEIVSIWDLGDSIPTYLIISRNDADNDSLMHQYGYIEYLSHDPNEEDIEAIIKNKILSVNPNDVSNANHHPICHPLTDESQSNMLYDDDR